MGVVAGISIHHAVADVSVRGTDRLHHTNEYKDAIVHGKNTKRKSCHERDGTTSCEIWQVATLDE